MLTAFQSLTFANIPIILHRDEILSLFQLKDSGEQPHITRLFIQDLTNVGVHTTGFDPMPDGVVSAFRRYQPGVISQRGFGSIEFSPVPLRRELVLQTTITSALRWTFDYRIKPGEVVKFNIRIDRKKRMVREPPAGETGHTMNKRQLLGA